ncbi:MAG: EAL domain-containing protein [Ruminococcaceae bacterium]|nr:EAL domain-containing protein [Oscillospiraceae bacterium]
MAEEKKETIKVPRARTMEMLFKPVFDVGLNMAVDYYTRVQLIDHKVGIIQPETYIPVAEKSNQIAEIGKWAIEEACDVMLRAEERDVGINSVILWTSLKHLNKKNFVKSMLNIADKKEIEHDKFCFWITDHILQADQDIITKNISELRKEGFSVAIDDFGVEYSSLSNLGQYEVDYIGIDASLTRDIEINERQQNMLQGIIDFVKKIETKVMVGGVETQERAELLKTMGVDRMSGPLYGDFIKEKEITL